MILKRAEWLWSFLDHINLLLTKSSTYMNILKNKTITTLNFKKLDFIFTKELFSVKGKN